MGIFIVSFENGRQTERQLSVASAIAYAEAVGADHLRTIGEVVDDDRVVTRLVQWPPDVADRAPAP